MSLQKVEKWEGGAQAEGAPCAHVCVFVTLVLRDIRQIT